MTANPPSDAGPGGGATLRRSGVAFADQLVVSGGNFLTIALCAHLLAAEEQGKVGIVLSTYLVTSIVNQTALFQMGGVRAALEGDTRSLLAGLASFQVLLGLAATAVLVAALVLTGDLIGMSPGAREVLVAGGYFLLQQYADFDRRSAYIFATPGRALASSLVVFPVRAGLLLLLAPRSMADAYLIVTLTALPPAAVTLARALRAPAGAGGRWRFMADHARRSRWLVASTPLAWAWNQVPVYFLGNMLGLEAVGAYVSVRGITNVANLGLELLETYFSPRLALAAHRGGAGDYRRMILAVLAVGAGFWLLGLVVILAAGPWIVGTLVGAQYVQYSDVLAWLWLAALLTFAFKLDAIDARTREVTQAIPAGYLSGVFCAVAGCILLLPGLGPVGAALARVAASVGVLAGQRATRVLSRARASKPMTRP